MKKNIYVSNSVIKRLPRYRRVLEDLINKKIISISSKKLSEMTGLTPSLIRKDFNNFGAFGSSGYGYEVKHLYQQIGDVLGFNMDYKIIIVGASHLGQAIASHIHFHEPGFNIVAMFTINPRLIGLRMSGIEVMDFKKLDEFLGKQQIDIGIITTNWGSAQKAADKLVIGEVKGIWSFATMDLVISGEVVINGVHLSDSLQSLTYCINRNSHCRHGA